MTSWLKKKAAEKIAKDAADESKQEAAGAKIASLSKDEKAQARAGAALGVKNKTALSLGGKLVGKLATSKTVQKQVGKKVSEDPEGAMNFAAKMSKK